MPRIERKGLVVSVVTGIVIGLFLYFGWEKVNWETVATTVVSAIIIGVLGYIGAPTYLRHLRKEGQLLAVAIKRREGVALRNEGEGLRAAPDVEAWLPKAEKWKTQAVGIVEEFSKVEGEMLETLDRTEKAGIQGLSPEHNRLLRILSTTLDRMYQLLVRHSPAQF